MSVSFGVFEIAICLYPRFSLISRFIYVSVSAKPIPFCLSLLYCAGLHGRLGVRSRQGVRYSSSVCIPHRIASIPATAPQARMLSLKAAQIRLGLESARLNAPVSSTVIGSARLRAPVRHSDNTRKNQIVAQSIRNRNKQLRRK